MVLSVTGGRFNTISATSSSLGEGWDEESVANICHNCNGLIFYILHARDVNTSCVDRYETSNRQDLFCRFAVFTDVFLEHANVICVEENVNFLVILVLMLGNSHVVTEISSNFASKASSM